MQFVTFRTKYSARARRAGVLSNFLGVSERVRGPRNGRHPMVNVIPAARTTTSTANTNPSVFPRLFILRTSCWHSRCDRSPTDFRTIKTQGDVLDKFWIRGYTEI